MTPCNHAGSVTMLTVVNETGRVVRRSGRCHLYLPAKDRLYVFVLEADYVWVRKYEQGLVIEDTAHSTARARSLWAWLTKLGYRRV